MIVGYIDCRCKAQNLIGSHYYVFGTIADILNSLDIKPYADNEHFSIFKVSAEKDYMFSASTTNQGSFLNSKLARIHSILEVLE